MIQIGIVFRHFFAFLYKKHHIENNFASKSVCEVKNDDKLNIKLKYVDLFC